MSDSENAGRGRHIGTVHCPHCGASEGELCQETGPLGPTGVFRSAHPERRELARELTTDTD